MAYKTTIRLLHPDGSFACYLTESALKTEIRKGNVRRASVYTAKNRVYQLIAQPKASESKTDKTQITRKDLETLVGIRRVSQRHEQQEIERLIGFGLLPENVAYPRNGYLA